MVKLLRFVCASALLVWLGVTISISFYVAPSLFSNASGHVPNSTVAAEIIAPLLHRMDVTAWVGISAAIACLFALWRLLGPKPPRSLLVAMGLLVAALLLSVYSGGPLNNQLHEIRMSLKSEFGGYHAAPKTHPDRAKFAKLHGVSMVITLVNLGLGFGAFFCVTQLAGAPRRAAADAPPPAPAS